MSEAVILAETVKPCLHVFDLTRRSGRHVTAVRLTMMSRDCWRVEYAAPGGAGVIVMQIAGYLSQVKAAIARAVDGSRGARRGRWVAGGAA